MHRHPHSLTAWLWWLAFLIAASGGAAAYMLRQNVVNESSLAWSNLVIAATIALSGICVISATSGWWMRR
ncbi:MAG: hypothetical protein BWK77_02185 [Verrucomicrobia bacterium A1]|nr:MAG: hypothetical protein BWK77_02185 [Verrucomicrobia bacterium A1]